MSITKTLDAIFDRFDDINKSRRKFFTELFEVLACVRGRFNFTNIARFSYLDESTLRRNYAQFFDWMKFQVIFFLVFVLPFWETESEEDEVEIIGSIDCSYIDKSGKKTYGIDRFWSGVANKTKKGLEVSLICLTNVATGQSFSLNVRQTPPGLSASEKGGEDYTRIDFYIEQIMDCIVQLPLIQYYVADGFYAKTKVLQALAQVNKHLICKLRPDANLKYLFDREANPEAHGNRKYNGKVNWNALNLDLWNLVGRDENHPHLLLYSQILYSPHFKCNLNVVFVWNTKTNSYVLLFSTDLKLAARKIVLFYQRRFKIEFIFRDAKQFMGLNHCQARSEEKLDFHFNICFAALNLYQFGLVQSKGDASMNSLIRRAYNTKLVKMLLSKLRTEPKIELNFDMDNVHVKETINFGQMRA